MQVVPICFVACLLVVSLSSAKVYNQAGCSLNARPFYIMEEKGLGVCQCKVREYGDINWDCDILACRRRVDTSTKITLYGRCRCKKGAGGVDRWKCHKS